MTGPKYDDDSLIEALRDDLPSAADEARVRARLLGAGLIVAGSVSTSSAAASGGAAAPLGTSSAGASLGGASGAASKGLASNVALSKVGILSKLALLPTATKVGLVSPPAPH
jgi:hypothetical protein